MHNISTLTFNVFEGAATKDRIAIYHKKKTKENVLIKLIELAIDIGFKLMIETTQKSGSFIQNRREFYFGEFYR